MNNLAICYENGIGCLQNPRKAFEMYFKSYIKGEFLGLYIIRKA